MRRVALFAVVLGVAAFAGPAFAQSSKSVMQAGSPSLIPSAAAAGWTTIMSGALHMAQQKDLVVDVSLEAGLFTETTVRSKNGSADTSWAEALIEVQVLVDGVPAYPGTVIFARRYQQLMAKFGGIIESCTDSNADGTLDIATECSVTEEELQLVLDTMNANSFNFMLDDLGAGDHVIQVQARLGSSSSAQAGAASANAVIGKASMAVEEVRLIKGLDLDL